MTDAPTPDRTNPTGLPDLPDLADLLDLSARLDTLEAWRHQFIADLDAADDALAEAAAAEAAGVEAVTADPPQLDPGDEVLDPDRLISWVHRHVAAVIARPLRGELRWCPLWWEHPEAVFRFEATRRAWTHLAPEPGPGMSTWIRDHLDPCLRELLSPLGPFADCSHNERFHHRPEHSPLPTLPTEDPAHPFGD